MWIPLSVEMEQHSSMSFEGKYASKSRYILDHYHLCEKLKQRIYPLYDNRNRRNEVMDTILESLNSVKVDESLDYIHGLHKRFRKHLHKLADYVERNREGIRYQGAREKEIPIGAGSADKTGDILICRRMKLRGMRWTGVNADNVLNIRILVLNGEWDFFWERYKAA